MFESECGTLRIEPSTEGLVKVTTFAANGTEGEQLWFSGDEISEVAAALQECADTAALLDAEAGERG
ncbi:hypothetical protein [Deinococcus rubellus]|uniref:hypothetical protein n=1 Tax=Deinococcus rubellus TaxID=1889240 RepID=UPI0031EF43E1